jgi:hypothetical protein
VILVIVIALRTRVQIPINLNIRQTVNVISQRDQVTIGNIHCELKIERLQVRRVAIIVD